MARLCRQLNSSDLPNDQNHALDTSRQGGSLLDVSRLCAHPRTQPLIEKHYIDNCVCDDALVDVDTLTTSVYVITYY